MGKIWLVILAVLAVAIGALLQALKSESFVLDLAYGGVKTFTDLRLEMHNPRVDFYGGSFSADQLHLIPKTTSGPALLSVLDLKASTNLIDLLNTNLVTSSLSASELLIYVSKNDDVADPSPVSWLRYLRWLPQALRIEQMHVISSSTETIVLPLKQLYGDRLGGGHYRVTSDLDYEGEPLNAVLDLYALIKDFGVRGANLKLTLEVPLTGSAMTLEGVLEADAADFHYDFSLDGNYQDLDEIAKSLPSISGLAGTMQVNARMVGSGKGFVLSDAQLKLDNTPNYEFEATGSLDYQIAGEHSLELAAHGQMASLNYLADLAGVDIGDLGSVQTTASVGGTLEQPIMHWFSVGTQNTAGLIVRLSGQLDLFSQRRGELSDIDNKVHITVQGPSLSVLDHWVAPPAYDPGRWQVSADLVEDGRIIALENISASAGEETLLAIQAEGRIGSVFERAANDDDSPALKIEGIDLVVNANTIDSTRLGSFLDLELPANHIANGTMKLTGNLETLEISDGAIAITSDTLDATISPLGLKVHPGANPLLTGLNAAIEARLSGTDALANYGAMELPELGPVALKTNLKQKASLYQLRDLQLSISGDNMLIEVSGSIGDLAALADVSLGSTFSGVDTGVLLRQTLEEFEYSNPLGSLSGAFQLRRKRDSWDLDKLVIQNDNSEGRLDFSADGSVQDISGLPRADLRASFSVSDPELLETLSGLRLRPVTGTLQVANEKGRIASKLTAAVGTTDLSAEGFIVYEDSKIGGLTLALVTPNLDLGDFGVSNADGDLAQESANNSDTAPPGAFDLTDLKAKSPSYPIDVNVKINGITGDNTNIDRFEVHLTGKDHSYTLDQFAVWYNNALAEARGIINLGVNPPAISLAGRGLAIPLGSLTKDLGINTNISGSLSVLGGLTATGTTQQTLVESLSGSLALALEDAVIEGAAYDLLATDLLEWIYSGAMTEKSTYLDCTMAKFLISNGIATSDSLYIESSKMVATGEVELNLVKQRLDLTLVPKSKSRLLQIPSKVRVHGKFDKLKPEISPVRALADASATALFLVPSLAMKLFNLNADSGKSQRPCQT